MESVAGIFAQDGSDINFYAHNADGAYFYINGRHIAQAGQETLRASHTHRSYEAGTSSRLFKRRESLHENASLPCSVDLAAFDCGVIDDDVRQMS